MREELSHLNERILNHPFVLDAESGKLPRDKLRIFLGQQNYIVSNDIRSIALMLSRSNPKEAEFFQLLLEGDLQAHRNLLKMAESAGIRTDELTKVEPIPQAVAYTHYLAFLACNASAGEQAFAMVVNLPVWGSACGRLSRALRERYGVADTSFLDAFAETPAWLEEKAMAIVEDYLPTREREIRVAAKLIQAYELMFWDGIYR